MQGNPGKKKCQNKKWISADTISRVQVREDNKGVLNNSRTRAAKAAAQKQYTEANRTVKKSIKIDKENFKDTLRMKQRIPQLLYDTTRKLAGKHKQVENPIKDKKGDVLTRDGDQL